MSSNSRFAVRPVHVWVLLALTATILFAWRNMDMLGDGFWYIAVGRTIWEHHAFPPDELFSYSAIRGPGVVIAPLSEVLFAWIADHAGLQALLLFCTAFFGLATALFWLPHARHSWSKILTWPLAFFFVFVERNDLSARGQTLAYTFLALLFILLFRVRDEKDVPWWQPIALGAFWINIHPSAILGILIPIAYAVVWGLSERENRPNLRPMLYLGGLVGAGALINPYGFGIIADILQLVGAESTMKVDLFASPDLRSPEVLIALGLGLGMVVATLRRPNRQAGVPEALLMVAMVLVACASRRYVSILVAYEIVLLGRILASSSWTEKEPHLKWFAPVAALPLALAVFAWPVKKDVWQHSPVAAARFIQEKNLPDNVINPLHWGGYLDYAWNGQRKIFIDGRTILFENGVFDDFHKLYQLTPDARPVLDMYIGNTILAENGSPLDQALSQDPDWENVFREGIAVVYVRKMPLP